MLNGTLQANAILVDTVSVDYSIQGKSYRRLIHITAEKSIIGFAHLREGADVLKQIPFCHTCHENLRTWSEQE